MSFTTNTLYQLDFVVKMVTRYGAKDQECDTSVVVQFLGLPPQTVCQLPAVGGCSGVSSSATVTSVEAGKTFTFGRPSDHGCSPPGPVCVTVRLYRLMGEDTLPCREELATGVVNVMIAPEGQPATEFDCERIVPLKDGKNGLTVAELSVVVRARVAGSLTTTPGPPCPSQSSPCHPSRRSPSPCARPPSPRTPSPPFNTKCGDKTRLSRPLSARCGAREARELLRSPSRSRRCDKNCRVTKKGRKTLEASPNVVTLDPNTQYSVIGCEVDGRKIDLRVRRKNYETCAVQRRITKEAETFTKRVMTVIQDMHGLISDSVASKIV